MTTKELIDRDKNGVDYMFAIIIMLMVGLVILSSIAAYVPFGFAKIHDFGILSSDGESIDKTLYTIDKEHFSYEDSAYDYAKEIQDKNYTVQGTIKIDEVDNIGDRVKITSTQISHKRKGRYIVLYLDKGTIEAKQLIKGNKIKFIGELNNIGEKYFIVNNLEKVGVMK